jgi:DNA repair exonuclease SbcCD nuclease subunit
MLRLLHTADVHLGARHTDLGERATVLRERQFTAFRVSVDLAIVEAVDLFLIAGDLFDSNTQPRRSVERVAAELARLAKASIRTVIIPGTHDVYDGASIYRSYDLAAMAKTTPEWITVLTPEQSSVWLPSLDAVVHGRVISTKRAPRSPLDGFDARMDRRATWRIGMVHGALAIPGRTDADDVVFTEQEIAKSGLDYVALGHWHSAIEGRAGNVVFAYSGAPEPVAIDQDGAGQVLLVTLDDRNGRHDVTIEGKRVGQTRCEHLDLDVSGIGSQPALIETIRQHADANAVLEVQLTGLLPDDMDFDLDEVERALAPSFLRVRVRDRSIPALPKGTDAPPDTVLGAFIRAVEGRIAELEAPAAAPAAEDIEAVPELIGAPAPQTYAPVTAAAEISPETAAELADLREVLRLGRHLLEGRQVTL